MPQVAEVVEVESAWTQECPQAQKAVLNVVHQKSMASWVVRKTFEARD